MEKLKQFSLAVVVSTMLSVSATAGEIEIGKTPPPPPSAASVTTAGDPQIPGEIGIGNAQSGPVTDVALSLLQTALSIF